MKFFTSSICLALIFCFSVFGSKLKEKAAPSPLASYSVAWNDPKYQKCNTAAKANYLTADEKEAIYILNMIRMSPALFAKTVLPKYYEKSSLHYSGSEWYYKTLLDTLNKIKPLTSLQPDSLCYVSALCHAVSSGNAAYVGHDRLTDECKQKRNYYGECCDYGRRYPIDIIIALLIDDGVPSLGHRDILLSSYKKAGISIQPHKSYGFNAVLDFSY